MANPFFKFKRFTIWHDKCAMKVGTDGVLLGAWADTGTAGRILDIGTGTGLIALMTAQRCTAATVDAIDIDRNACLQALENKERSDYANRVNIIHASLDEYARTCSHKYDLIVSNPPYFSQSLKCPDTTRSIARHDDSLPLEELIATGKSLLTEKGRIALILPVEQEKRLEDTVAQNQMCYLRRTYIRPLADGPVKRILAEVSPSSAGEVRVEEIAIELSRHIYTPAYQALTGDFYLNM